MRLLVEETNGMQKNAIYIMTGDMHSALNKNMLKFPQCVSVWMHHRVNPDI
jgi:hypothetical protein